MTPIEFIRHCRAYERRHRREAVFFREMYALLVNINRKADAEPVTGPDILRLAGDPPKKVYRKRKEKKISREKYDAWLKRFNP